MVTATLTSKGQITIPKEVREKLGLETGDRLVFDLGEDGVLAVRPASPPKTEQLRGLLRRYAPEVPISLSEMRAAIGQRARAASSTRRRRPGS